MNDIVCLNEYKSTVFEAKRCEEKAKIYEEIHDKLNDIYLSLFTEHGLSIDLSEISDTAQEFLTKANLEWVAKRQYEKGEL